MPGAPTNVVATAGNAQAAVAFTVPASNGGSEITEYTVTASPGGATASGAASPIVVTGLSNGTAYTFTVTATNVIGTGPASAASSAVTPEVPTLDASPSALSFAATKNGSGGDLSSVTLGQTVTVSFSSGAPSWTVSANQPWIALSQTGGTGAGTFVVSIVNPSNVLGASTAVQATLTVAATGAANSPRTIPVTLTIDQSNGATVTGPIGQVDTPGQDATGVQGAIGVTGWVLDNIGVTGVKIYRNCLAFEDQASCQTILGQSMVFIGDAAFLAGARPDVETAFSSYPAVNRGGWGYLMLTSMLPQVITQQSNGGVGPLTIYAVATDVEGNQKILGRSSDPNSPDFTTPTRITMANDSIAKPFGAIDTPAQGATVSGVVPNFGWVLTPDSNTTGGEPGDMLVPVNGSRTTVFIDGMAVAQVAYNQCRGTVGNPVPPTAFCNDDVANIFGNATPQPTFTPRVGNATRYRNLDAGRGAIGAYDLDTRLLSNGLHTIAWSVTDSAERTEGIGSRFFIVLNGGSDACVGAACGVGGAPAGASAQAGAEAALRAAPATARGVESALAWAPPGEAGVWWRPGFAASTPWTLLEADEGVYSVTVAALDRLDLWLGAPASAGYLVANGTLRDLPVGSTLSGAQFAWAPPAGYLGTYRLVFLRAGERVTVDVTVR